MAAVVNCGYSCVRSVAEEGYCDDSCVSNVAVVGCHGASSVAVVYDCGVSSLSSG